MRVSFSLVPIYSGCGASAIRGALAPRLLFDIVWMKRWNTEYKLVSLLCCVRALESSAFNKSHWHLWCWWLCALRRPAAASENGSGKKKLHEKGRHQHNEATSLEWIKMMYGDAWPVHTQKAIRHSIRWINTKEIARSWRDARVWDGNNDL